MSRSPAPERVVMDSSALLSDCRSRLVAAAHLGYAECFWSTWIVAEVARVRTEWIAQRAARERCDGVETRRRLEASRQRVNLMMAELSSDLRSVDYHDAPPEDLSWLADLDDWPIMQTALVAGAQVLVTHNGKDFPLGERRNGVLCLHSRDYLARLYKSYPEAEADIAGYLETLQSG